MTIRKSAAVLLCALGLTLGAVGTAHAIHESEHTAVSMADLPTPVKNAIDQRAKGGSVPLIEKFEREGKTLFRAHIEKNGKLTDVDLDSNGNVVKE